MATEVATRNPLVRYMYPHELPAIQLTAGQTAWAQLSPREQTWTTPWGVAQSAAQMISDALARPGGAVLVADAGGLPVGYTVVDTVRPPSHLTTEGRFLDIFVHPAWRGSGLAKSLVDAGTQHLQRWGCRSCHLLIANHNESSQKVAKKAGFQVERLILGRQV